MGNRNDAGNKKVQTMTQSTVPAKEDVWLVRSHGPRRERASRRHAIESEVIQVVRARKELTLAR